MDRLVNALRHYSRTKAFEHGKAVHSQFIKLGLSNFMLVANNLITMYAQSSSLRDAIALFDEMPERNLVTWTIVVSACTSVGNPDLAIKLFARMLEREDESPNGFVYSAVLKACGLAGDLELGRSIHDKISGTPMESDTVLMNSLLDMYVKCGSMSNARRVFDHISKKTFISWNTMISGFCKEGDMEAALSLFRQMPERNVTSWNNIIAGFADKRSPCALEYVSLMHREGYKLDEFSFPCALKACGSLVLVSFGRQLHSNVIKSGFESSCFSASALIDMYSDCNELGSAVIVYDQYTINGTSVHESLALSNSILSGYVVVGQNEAALYLLSEIYSSGVYMDTYTYSSALKSCINMLNLRLGLQVHGLVVTSGYELDHIVGSILVDLYAKLGKIDDALGLFTRLPNKDVVAWSGLIVGCAKMGFNSLAFSLFREMMLSGIDVDEFVLSCILKVCSSLAFIGCGKQVHGFCLKSGFEADAVTVTSLTDMYAKCGDIDAALQLFNCLLVKDTVCWTGIIVGCGQNGRVNEAINLFNEMLQTRLKPNEVTFLGVLAACRHGGLVDHARSIFKSMQAEHGLEPHFEHFYCMVELLGQAGYLEEAEELIGGMPLKPDKTIWGSLLTAGANHKNVELVSRVAKHLLESYPEDPAVNVTLSNVYATLGMWDDLRKVRETLTVVGGKIAGKSWVEI